MKKTSSLLAGLVLSIEIFAPAKTLAQGNLTPSGPPGPTMRTLEQIEPRKPVSSLPFVITSSGSYYLTTNLTGANGVLILVDDVTLDLNGFTLLGTTNSGNGIAGGVNNISIRNGTVRNWGSHGVNLTNSSNCRLVDLRVADNGLAGLVVGN